MPKQTPAQREYKKRLITAIMTENSRRGIWEDKAARHRFAKRHYGKEGISKLSINELLEVREYTITGKLPPHRYAGMNNHPDCDEPITPAQKRRIEEEWQEKSREKTEESLLRFCSRFNGGAIPIRLAALSKGAAGKVIVALNAM